MKLSMEVKLKIVSQDTFELLLAPISFPHASREAQGSRNE
jgi:hypothetical protein